MILLTGMARSKWHPIQRVNVPGPDPEGEVYHLESSEVVCRILARIEGLVYPKCHCHIQSQAENRCPAHCAGTGIGDCRAEQAWGD